MMTERTQELYNNMLNHISELVSGSDLVDTLRAIGFTDDEIIAEGFDVDNKADELLQDLRIEQCEQM